MSNVTYFDTNICSVENIEQLYSGYIKNKVIARIDLCSALDDCLTPEIIKSARGSLIGVARGTCTEENLATILDIYLKVDEKFRKGINILFNECPATCPFGRYIPYGFANRMIKLRDEIKQSFVGQSEFYICESDGYVYFSFPDVEGYTFDRYPYEVISNAKNWHI